MRTSFKGHTKTFFAGMFALGACVLYVVVAYVSYTEKQSVRMLVAEISTEESRWRNARLIVKQTEETRADREYLRSLILEPRDVIRMIDEIERLGHATNVSVAMKSIGVEHKEGNTSPLAVRMTIEGNREDMLRFMNIFADAPYALSFNRFGMELSDDGIWKGDITCIIRNFKEE